MIEGWRVLRKSGRGPLAIVAVFALLAVLMLPVGRTAPGDGGGLLAPLTVDSGALFRQRPAADFFSVYDAGARLLVGRDPYSVNEDEGRPGVRAPYVASFRYLPVTVVWLAVPLNLLPPWPAYYTWVAICFGLQVASFLLCVGRAPERLVLLAGIWFGWFPLIAEWHMGQFTFLMAVLMLWGFDGLMSGSRHAWVGWFFASLLKVYPVGMGPSLWRWGWRGPVVAVGLLILLPTIAWRAAAPAGFDEGMINRGVGGRIIGELRLPYMGAMGVQSLNGAVVWSLAGQAYMPNPVRPNPPIPEWAPLAAKVLNATTLGLYLLGAFWVLVAARKPSWEAVGYYWLAWFFAYVDCWEHHYVLIQTLLGGLVAWRVIDWRVAVVAWAAAGGPSLWYAWFKLSQHAPELAEWLGLPYFLQRPVAIWLLAVVLLVRFAQRNGKTA